MFLADVPSGGFHNVQERTLADVFQHPAHLDDEQDRVEEHEARKRDRQIRDAEVAGRQGCRPAIIRRSRLTPKLGDEPAQLGRNPRSRDREDRCPLSKNDFGRTTRDILPTAPDGLSYEITCRFCRIERR